MEGTREGINDELGAVLIDGLYDGEPDTEVGLEDKLGSALAEGR